jgi:hypothetical protein
MSLIIDGSNGLTFPNSSVQTIAANSGPAFSAYQGASQTISNNTYTKLQINTKEFDTASAYDNATNYRFTPLVAGYYQVNGAYYPAGVALGYNSCAIYKNGSIFKSGNSGPNNTTTLGSTVSCLIYLNGSTDYIEFYALQSSGGNLGTSSTAPYTYFQASMVRSA